MRNAIVGRHTAGFNTMVGAKALVIGVLCLTIAACSASELTPLVLEGPELHHSLVTGKLSKIRHVPRSVVGGNPYLSADPEFVEAIGRGSSQGRLDGKGVRLALFAFYGAESDLGFYGLEAASEADADRREDALRGIWAYTVRLDRARVHRGNLVLVVVWHDGVSLDCWEAVNSGIAERLVAP
jgi:hypothetical protein